MPMAGHRSLHAGSEAAQPSCPRISPHSLQNQTIDHEQYVSQAVHCFTLLHAAADQWHVILVTGSSLPDPNAM